MKKYRTSAEIKNSIFKGLDEAIELSEKIPLNKVTGEKTSTEFKIAEAKKDKKWSHTEESKLRAFAGQKVSLKEIGMKLGRTPGAVQNKAIEMGLILR